MSGTVVAGALDRAIARCGKPRLTIRRTWPENFLSQNRPQLAWRAGDCDQTTGSVTSTTSGEYQCTVTMTRDRTVRLGER